MPFQIILCHYCTSSEHSSSDIYLPIITALLSAGLTYLIAFSSNRKAERKHLDEQLDSILKAALQYPFFEMEDFTNNWSKEKLKSDNKEEAEKYQRYDIYTNLVFNYMERLAQYHNYNSDSILKHVNIKAWIKTHKKIWENPSTENEQRDGYPDKLKELLKTYLKDV